MFHLPTVRLFFVLLALATVTSAQARVLQNMAKNTQNPPVVKLIESTQHQPEDQTTVIDTVALIDELISPHWVFHNRSADEWLASYPNAKVERTPITNLHNDSKTDTVIEVKTEKTHLRFYRANEKDLLLEAKVSFEPLSIGKGLSMGMNKKDFMRCFSETEEGMEQNVVVVVMDSEETNYYFFTFEQNILVAVHYEGIID